MTSEEFEDYLVSLKEEEYDLLIQERITRLNEDQQKMVQAREVRRKERAKLYEKMNDPNPEVRKEVLNAIMVGEGNTCEHGRLWVKHCMACGTIDHLMFPEMFDADGFPLDEEE